MKTIKRIHVNQHLIRKNDPSPLTVKTTRGNTRASSVQVLDDQGTVVATVVYSPDKPLSCGARVWIETKNDLLVV